VARPAKLSDPMAGHSSRVFPVTYEQEAIWLEDAMDPASSIYLVAWVVRLRGTVDTGAVEWTISQIVARHPALYSGLEFDGERIVQVMPEDHAVVVERLGRPDLDLDRALEQLVQRPLDLRVSPLRVTLLELAADDFVLIIQLHHVVVDDWSMAILEREFQEFYCARIAGRAARLPPLPLLPGEHAAAQRSAGIDPSVRTYWRERLRDAPTESTVPADQQSPRRGSPGEVIQFRIDAALGVGLRTMARRSRATAFTVLAAAVTVLLYAYNGSADQVLGTVVSRRGSAGVDQMFTCLAGIMPMRQSVRAEEGFGALVASTKQVVTGVIAHRDIPFSVVLRELKWRRSFGRPPLCQVVLVVDDVPRGSLELPGVTTERLYPHSGISLADLVISLLVDGDGYRGRLIYASDLFHPQTAERIATDLCALLAAGVAQPDLPLADVIAAVTPDRH
jgi:Condensation domain